MDFSKWVLKYSKRYSSVEFLRRRAIFIFNSRLVNSFNSNTSNTFKLSVEGPLAAMTETEYFSLLKRFNSDPPTNVKSLKMGFPASLDLRADNKVTPVRNQGDCGGCYAFGSLSSLEGRLLMIGGNYKTLDLSEEQIVQCSLIEGNNGCWGGLGKRSFEYIKKNGVVQESDYPYTAVDGKCLVDLTKKFATIGGYINVPSKDVNELKSALVGGVVDVSIDARTVKLQLYKSGVYTDKNCKSEMSDLNHEVSAVGYGNENGQEYWIVKNSWGEEWGDKGFILMAIENNTCGVATDALYPIDVNYVN
ncbi:cysteine proteinase 2 precursor, putative [Entamoeba invadens IP1]|uniref:cysteine proteinase 2 precursor, putative n=1 Tax=Entamoeba invadens IP1 TaxID=370355 RepID=UPI0002C3F49A|nr:cysteine proteinase 2 precursor, putative [Entamoeba invadens IP1]ELP90453.1 cysteine proteinase 2 precursor, putative [Entamoeba invadens IP1]|eukprot:XP_004257224.1 cysteine proteinase 2 precursor, putative [Entamoeba invadens IP1]